MRDIFVSTALSCLKDILTGNSMEAIPYIGATLISLSEIDRAIIF